MAHVYRREVLLRLERVPYEFKRGHGAVNDEAVQGTLTLFKTIGPRNSRCYLQWCKEPSNDNSEKDDISVINGVDLEDELLLHLTDVSSFKIIKRDEMFQQLTIIEKDGKNHKPILITKQQFCQIFDIVSKFVKIRQSEGDSNLYIFNDLEVAKEDKRLSDLNLIDHRTLAMGAGEGLWHFVSDVQKDPYAAALTAFSKLAEKFIFSEGQNMSEYIEVLQRSLTFDDYLETKSDEEDFEVILSKPKFVEKLELKPRLPPLSHEEFDAFLDKDGVIEDLRGLKLRIFRGGIDSGVRPKLWKFLLGMYEWKDTPDTRDRKREGLVKEYFRMKLQWQSLDEKQESRFSAFRERKCQVEKDSIRTDRAEEFYKGTDNIERLYEILMTHVMYDFDLGYVQGMSDLLSPIFFVLGNEVDAFWCFSGFVEMVKTNFDLDQAGIKKQLVALHDLVKVIDPEMYVYLVSKEAENFLFCFRWLLIWFKREFSFSDIMTLWEIMWTDIPCKNFHLLISISLLYLEKSIIIENKFGFSEILKHINDMNNTLDLDRVLQTAEAIHDKLMEDDYVNDRIRELLT